MEVKLIGNYKLNPATLGKGSFSQVVLANHVILNKQVALKVVTLHKIKDPYVSKNLKREAAIMAKLNHPNIVSLHEVVSVGDFYCLVLDFYPGGNLCDMIGRQEGFKLKEEIARALFRQILAELGYLHNKSIIHRDIKLENILLDATHTKAVIADFGLSNFWDASSILRTRCGSAEVISSPFLWIPSSSNPASVCCTGDLQQAGSVHTGRRHVVSWGLPLCHVSGNKPMSQNHKMSHLICI